jgi:hypothetical protein
LLLTPPGLHPRHESPTPSDPSTASLVKENPQFDASKHKVKRRQTQVLKVNIPSRWACLLGLLFGPRKAEEKANVIVVGPDGDDEDGEVYFPRSQSWTGKS